MTEPELSQLFYFKAGLEALAAHCSAGRSKYPDVDGRPNWTLGGKPDQEYLDSATRHLASLVRGETHDPETHTLHAAAIAWNMLAMITLNHDDDDDLRPSRPKHWHDVSWSLSTDPLVEVIDPEDWFALPSKERDVARKVGFIEQLDGSAMREGNNAR